MRKILLSLPAALVLAASPVAVTAQTPDRDVRCMLTSNLFANKETDAKRREVAFAAVAYYLGRIDARLSPAQFRASAAILVKQPIAKDVAEFMTGCARTMQQKQVATLQILQQFAPPPPPKKK